MNIVQALFFPPEQPGGVSSMVPYIKERFVQHGWAMDLFYLPKRVRNKGKEDPVFETFDWREYLGHPIVDKYIQTFRDYLWWVRLRIRQNYELVHAHHPIAALAMKQVYPDTPLMTTVHSSYERELALNSQIRPNGLEHQFLTSLYRELEARSDRVTTVSASFKQYMADYVDQPEAIRVIPNGFDERRFQPMAHDNTVPQLITVCRLVPAKGIDILLKACALLKQRNVQYVLHLIGDGPIRKPLEESAQKLGIYDETIFYGYMLHPEQFMPFSDIFVLPSRAEAFGSVFAEAALCSLALIGTSVGGIAEQIEHGVNGLLVPPEDEHALADAIEKLIVNPAYRVQLAQAAAERARRYYSLNRVIAELELTYAELLAPKSE